MGKQTADLTGIVFLESFCSALTGEVEKRFRAAIERRAARIAEIGYPAYRAEVDAIKQRIIAESNQSAQVNYAKALLEKSGLGEKFFTRTFMSFRATPQNEYALNSCIDLVEGRREKGIIISGSHGIGKTHLAAAVVNAMANKGRQAYFRNIVDLVDEIKDSFKSGTERVIDRIFDASFIVLDDLGAEHTKTDSGFIDSLLYKIVNRAYEDNKTLIITTNLDEYDFAKRYNTRIVSRLHEMCDSIRYEEQDQRLEPTDEKMPWDKG
jgi:DNA replication protein DnaC